MQQRYSNEMFLFFRHRSVVGDRDVERQEGFLHFPFNRQEEVLFLNMSHHTTTHRQVSREGHSVPKPKVFSHRRSICF